MATLVLAGGVAAGSASADLDQTPILRVLRSNDVRGSENLLLPSGALTLKQLVGADTKAGAGRTAEKAALSGGFTAAAISAFGGPGSRQLRSFAVEFGTSSQAAQALTQEAKVLTGAAASNGAVATRGSVSSLPDGIAISYGGSANGPSSEIVLLAQQGNWLFSLRGSGDHGGASRSFLAGLLGQVISRPAS